MILANMKALPLVWHLRLLRAYLDHFLFSPVTLGPAALFQPLVTLSRAPFAECDFYGHKSNSTYITDVDSSRFRLVACLFHKGVTKLRKTPGCVLTPNGMPATGRFVLAIGSTYCGFQREIKPYEPYEIWSRILAWDQKWIYVVTHFVKKGTLKSQRHTLDKATPQTDEDGTRRTGKYGKPPSSLIYASVISKFVVKLGRITVYPEVFLDLCGLLPHKPEGWDTAQKVRSESSGETKSKNLPSNREGNVFTNQQEDLWDWRRIEQQNEKGLVYARKFAEMDCLRNDFEKEEYDRIPLGVYSDML